MKNETFRLFSIVAYEDSENMSFNNIYTNIIKSNLKYFYILHDKDENKKHYHILIYYEKPTTIKHVAKQLEIEENYIRIKDETGSRYTLKKTIGYFLHYNNKDKYNYSIEDFSTNCIDMLEKYYNILTGGSNERNELSEIIIFIEDNRPTLKSVLRFCIENNYFKTYKKYSYSIIQMIREERSVY